MDSTLALEPFESQGARAAKRYVNGNLVEREKTPTRRQALGRLPTPPPSARKSATQTAQKTALCAPCEHNLQAPLFYVVGQNSARADSGIMGWADIWGDIWVDL